MCIHCGLVQHTDAGFHTFINVLELTLSYPWDRSYVYYNFFFNCVLLEYISWVILYFCITYGTVNLGG